MYGQQQQQPQQPQHFAQQPQQSQFGQQQQAPQIQQLIAYGQHHIGVQPLIKGTGPIAVPGSTAVVHYTGTLTNGQKFDSSRDRGQPFSFQVGAGKVIKGWDIALTTMQSGDRTVFTIPAPLAYGQRGSPPAIPPNATLVFDIEVMQVSPPQPQQQLPSPN